MANPRSRGERQAPVPESILEQRFVEPILQGAKENLQRDGALMPVLFLGFQEAEAGIMPLALPDTTEGKCAYFAVLGLSFLSMGKRLKEALFLSETWYVSSDVEPHLTPEVRPSQHPLRREAITLVGRNALRTRTPFGVELFHRDAENRLFFDAKEVEKFNVDTEMGTEGVGLLDALFPRDPDIR